MREPVADVLARVAHTNQQLGPLLIELLNNPDEAQQATNLRELGHHLGELAAEVLARAAELGGRQIDPPAAVIIDARP